MTQYRQRSIEVEPKQRKFSNKALDKKTNTGIFKNFIESPAFPLRDLPAP
jgi:hypothetical protein